LRRYFQIGSELALLDDDTERQISESQVRINRERKPTDRVTAGESGRDFEVAMFFEGVEIGHAFGIRGASLFPVSEGLRDENVFEAIAPFLRRQHTVELPPKDEWGPFLNWTPVFAITVHHIVAVDGEDAANYAWKIASDIALIISSEQGDKARPIAQFVLEHGGGWQLQKVRAPNYSNLLGPMSPHLTIQGLHPLISQDAFLRLIFELMVDAMGERDRGLRIFRAWAVLEVISDRKVAPSKVPLTNHSGIPILLPSGDPLTTQRKEGRVFAMLSDIGLPCISVGSIPGGSLVIEGARDESWQKPQRLIGLSEAVAAHYAIRNEVAHEGRFDAKRIPTTDREALSKEFFTDGRGFLMHALRSAVRSQITAATARIGVI